MERRHDGADRECVFVGTGAMGSNTRRDQGARLGARLQPLKAELKSDDQLKHEDASQHGLVRTSAHFFFALMVTFASFEMDNSVLSDVTKNSSLFEIQHDKYQTGLNFLSFVFGEPPMLFVRLDDQDW